MWKEILGKQISRNKDGLFRDTEKGGLNLVEEVCSGVVTHSFIHSLIQYLFSTYYMPGTVSVARVKQW